MEVKGKHSRMKEEREMEVDSSQQRKQGTRDAGQVGALAADWQGAAGGAPASRQETNGN